MELIRHLFQDADLIKDNPPTPPKSRGNIGMGSKSKPHHSSLSLPFNPGSVRVHDDTMRTLAGLDPKAKSAETGGLQTGTYLKKPALRESSYRVTGNSGFTHAAPVPLEFRSLQPASKASRNPGLSFTHAETLDFEVQLRRMAVVISHQDWFLGAVLEIIERHIKSTSSVPDVFNQMRDLLQSGSQAGYDAQKLLGHLQYNWILRRRDAYIRDTFHDLPAAAKRSIRIADLHAPALFDPDVCNDTHRRYADTSVTRAAHKAAQPQQYRNPRPTVLERSHPQQQQSRQRNNWPSQSPHRGKPQQGHRGKPKSASSTPAKRKHEGARKKK